MSPRASYGGREAQRAGGGVVASVDAGGPAAWAGLGVGDAIVSADGEVLRDIIDWQWQADGPSVELRIIPAGASNERSLVLTRKAGEPWGVDFTDAVFDGVRTCRNNCAFCFMTQLPKGLRPALYLRDDDYRLSFLQGNFVTLTNLADADVTRIAEQHLSPLYVSLHAVDPDVRNTLVCAREDRALERFDEMLAEGIGLHVQIVLVPGVNDGEQLERSLTWLAEREGVLSVGIVPLGFTAHQEQFSASFEGSGAASVIDQVAAWQDAFRQRDGVTWVYLADEFYLKAGVEVPLAEEYDGFPQYENGIGMIRSFVDDLCDVADRMRAALRALPTDADVTVLTGEMFAPVITAQLEQLRSPSEAPPRLHILGVANGFFGGNVGVTGLLTASDLCLAIASTPAAGVVLIPDIVANADGLLLDDVRATDLGTTTGRDVRLISCDAGGLLAALEELAANPPSTHKE